MNNYARENKTQVLILLLVLSISLVGGMIVQVGLSEEVEAQSTYTSDETYNIHTDAIRENNLIAIDENRILTGSGDETIKLRNIQTDTTELTFNQHTFSVKGVERLSNGKIASISREELYIWDLDTGNVQASYTSVSDANALEKLSDGRLLIGEGNKVLIVDQNGNLDKSFTLNLNSNVITYLEQLQNGNIAYALNGEPFIVTSDLDGNKINSLTNYNYTEFLVRSLDVADNGNILAAGNGGSMELDTDLNILKGTTETTSYDIVETNNNNVLVAGPNGGFILKRSDLSKQAIYEDPDFSLSNSVGQTPDGKVVLGYYGGGVSIHNNLPDITSRIADPVSVTDIQQSSETFTFYAVGNADVSNTDTLTWEFGDGTTTTSQANETVSHNYNTHGRYTVNVTTSDGDTRSTEVVVNSKPSISNTINPNPVLEGESISLDGSGSDSLTTAARPAPSQLQVTSGLRSWIPYDDTSSIDDSLYNGWTGDGVDLGNALSHDNPTSLYSIYSTSDKDESYITNPVDLQQDWTISTFIAAGSNSVAPVWLSSSGHGVYFDNGDLKRVYPSGSEVIGQVDPSNGGVNLTVTHDSSGSFTYYADGNLIGSDSYSSTVSDATYITQAPNSIDGQSQDTDVYLDNWRIYDRVLSQNEIDLIDDSYTVQTLSESKLYYDYQLDGSTISTNSTHTISGLQAGNYTVKLTVQDNDGLTSTSTKTLEVKDVVAPRIDNVSPAGDLNQRDIDIQADVSHPQIGSNYEVEVVLTRVNQQTGQTKTLVTKNITSNQVVNYDATHTNTGVENYNVNREYFEYEWTAQEPQQGLTESSGIKRYSIPVAEVIINNVNTEGLQSSRDVDLSADIDGTVTSSLDVRLELYDLREDETTTEYQTTINSAQTVSTTISHSLNRTAVPSDYRTQNRYSYQWVVTTDSGTTERSQTRDYLIPGLIYPVNENANLVGGVEDIINVADLTAEQDDYELSRSGKYNSSVFLPDFSRSYTALMYDTTDSAVFNKTFSADNEAFDFSGINLKDAYLVLSTEIGDNTYGVSAKRFQNGNVTLDVKDGVEYFVSVTDGETRRSVGPYIADKDNKDESQSVSPDSLDFQETEQIQSQVSTTYDSENETGSITIEWSAGDKEVENLRVEVIRDDDDKIIFRDSVGGRVENYKNTVAISDVNSTYTTNFEYYLVNESKTVTSSEKVTIKFQQVLDGLPDWMTTALGVVILLMMTFILGEISAAYGLVAVVAAGGVMTVIGWLPISITVVMQAGLVAILYFIQSDSTVT